MADQYACECHRRMGNDFYFLPTGQCLYDGCRPAKPPTLAQQVIDSVKKMEAAGIPDAPVQFFGRCGNCGGHGPLIPNLAMNLCHKCDGNLREEHAQYARRRERVPA